MYHSELGRYTIEASSNFQNCTCGSNSTMAEYEVGMRSCSCNAGYGGDATLTNVGCSPCGVASFKSTLGNTLCSPCPPGSVIEEGVTNAISITACVCGLNSALVELNDDSSRCECNAGYGGDASIVSVGCSPCGTYHYKSNTGNTQCTQCPPGSMIGEGVTNGTSSSLCGCGLNAEMSTETGRCECSAGYGGDATVAGVGCSPCGS